MTAHELTPAQRAMLGVFRDLFGDRTDEYLAMTPWAALQRALQREIAARHLITVHTDRARGVTQGACTCGDRSRVYDVQHKSAARRHAIVHRISATRLDEVRAEARAFVSATRAGAA